MSAQQAIGIFDSGIGGLTVAQALEQAFPQENFIYFGDTAHLPYGEKSDLAIISYLKEITQFFERQGCKMVVLACNSASAVALPALKASFPKLPLIDVINPLIQDLVNRPLRKIGVIATKATIRSDVYAQKLQELKPELEVASLATALLAPLIEEGFFNQSISHSVISRYLNYPDFQDIDALILACTHYPLIRPEIEGILGSKVAIFDSIQPVVREVKRVLDLLNLANTSQNKQSTRFFVSDYTRSFEETTRIFYGKTLTLQSWPWQADGALPLVQA